MQRDIQKQQILKDLQKKMVIIVGPRQAGKTWLAKEIAKNFSRSVYLNYDSLADRRVIKNTEWLASTELLIFDEIHKMRGWKNYLKGLYDTKPEGLKILVTGSAKLDAHKKSGDSMAGRYYTHHLFPFQVVDIDMQTTPFVVERLISRGGFPEPFLADSDDNAARWRTEYVENLTRDDILTIAAIENMTALKQVLQIVRHKVGSNINISSIAGDVGISPVTVRRYLSIFEALYIIFTIRPYTHKIARSILKESKVYFYDTGLVEGDAGAKFENMVALGVLAHLERHKDLTGRAGRLAFLKTKEKKEVDFVMVGEDNTPIHLIEAKVSDKEMSPTLKYFSVKYGVPATQVVQNLNLERKAGERGEVRKADTFLRELPSL